MWTLSAEFIGLLNDIEKQNFVNRMTTVYRTDIGILRSTCPCHYLSFNVLIQIFVSCSQTESIEYNDITLALARSAIF